MKYLLCTATLTATALFGQTAQAQVLHAGGGAIQDTVCIGADCTGSEIFGFESLQLKENDIRIVFNDVSASASFPNNDWQLTINDTINGGEEKFAVDDLTSGNTPFTIKAAAPDNALYVEDGGEIGIGTSTPVVELHILDGDTPSIRLDQNGSGGFPAFTWDMGANDANFFVRDATNGVLPLRILPGANNGNALVVAANGNVGLGTETPGGQLELSADTSFNFFRITATGATVDSVDITYTNGPLSNGELRYNIVDGDGPEMRLDGDGKLTIVGELVTAGSCSVGCDAVFGEDYALKSIEEHQAQMWSNGYLPNVGPTPEDGSFNVSDKMGRMLNELEHAHIYIGQQQAMIRALQATQTEQNAAHAAELAALNARLATLEAQD